MNGIEAAGSATPIRILGGGATPDLEARWLEPRAATERACVLAPPHPLYGGTLDSPILVTLERAARAAGLAVLRFNWRGVEGSAGRATDDPGAAVADYLAALGEAARRVPGPLVAGGYSWGAMAAVRAAAEASRVDRLVLVAPPALMLDATALAVLARAMLVFAGEHDRIAPPPRLASSLAPLARAELVTFAGADHFFAASLGEMDRVTRAWLERDSPR
ncbi:MAG: alpha/beta fold hydrolase [bacterium]